MLDAGRSGTLEAERRLTGLSVQGRTLEAGRKLTNLNVQGRSIEDGQKEDDRQTDLDLVRLNLT